MHTSTYDTNSPRDTEARTLQQKQTSEKRNMSCAASWVRTHQINTVIEDKTCITEVRKKQELKTFARARHFPPSATKQLVF